VFTGGSSEKFRIAPAQVQIDTTGFRPQRHVKSALSAAHFALNRTAVVYDISHNAITSAASMGQVSLQWQVAGIAADPPPSGSSGASIGQFAQALAAFAPESPASASSVTAGVASELEQTNPLLVTPH